MSARHDRALSLALAAVAALAACGDANAVAYRHDTVQVGSAPARPLGWLGAHARPLVGVLEVESDGDVVAPGGLVLADLAADGPLARAGARVGDAIVRVAGDWVPLRDDPTLAVIDRIEQEASGGRASTSIAVWREGALVDLDLTLPSTALEVGLPTRVERFEEGARAAAERLIALPEASGPHAQARDALVALALRASGAAEEGAEPRWSAALDRIEARIDARTPADALDVALECLLGAERIGPLPDEVRVRLAPQLTVALGQHGAGHAIDLSSLPPGAISFESAEGLDIQEMLDSAGAGGSFQIVTSDSPPEGVEDGTVHLPEGFQIPEGAQIMVGKVSGDSPLSGGMHLAGAGPPEAVPLADVLAELDPGRIDALERLRPAVERLLATQREDGAFAAADADEDSALITTSLALAALGAAQRVGFELEGDATSRCASWLRTRMDGGKVAAAVAHGADRRQLAGRAALVAWALLEANAPETDPFVRALLEYSDEKGPYLLESASAIGLHTLATAAVRRGRGLLDWQRFYDSFRIALVSWQAPDGGFELPADAAAPGWTGLEADPAVATALGVLLLRAQEQRPAVLLGAAENPAAPVLAPAEEEEAAEGADGAAEADEDGVEEDAEADEGSDGE